MDNINIRQAVEDFLHLWGKASEVDKTRNDTILKAGVVPYVRNRSGEIEYLFMKPAAIHPELPPPKFQICKGTRMCRSAQGEWLDMKNGLDTDGKRESLEATALREGIEELGIRLKDIKTITDLGPYDFPSASQQTTKRMHLFGLEMHSKACVASLEKPDKTTAERGWMNISEFKAHGRGSHVSILCNIADKL